MLNRRRFLQTIVVAATVPSARAAAAKGSTDVGFGKLRPDPDRILDLPQGFSYQVISQYGKEMNDGLLVPARHDGMAAFPGKDGSTLLVCNHENPARVQRVSAFGAELERLDGVDRSKIYDYGKGATPGTGGTTTIVYDTALRRRRRIHLSLAGTEYNCAGGPTPWGSWLSCEEIFRDPGSSFEYNGVVNREKRHGYVFEVRADEEGLADPVPLKDMGRFEHEAAAVNPATGIVYMTEDRYQSLWYRFLPNVPGRLREGGKLQAMAIKDMPKFDTRNWIQRPRLEPGTWLDTTWVDLEKPDVKENNLRFRGRRRGATIFARGEGLCYADGEFFMTATVGGKLRYGQVFNYRPSPAEGTPAEDENPGRLQLLAESTNDSLLHHADNLTMSPWGDLVVCEDTIGHCGLVGLQMDGTQYPIADNAYTDSELAGVCFSPDGSTMFVNIQERGLTLAITGPWDRSGSG
jgi:secreted PhoX family phosphatase